MNAPPVNKTVCIVGAGPAGLVAAKTLAEYGGYSVTVYEAADRVGGMWRGDDKCSPDLRTNLSRFTVAFADLSWSSVDLSADSKGLASANPPIFPRAWQVQRYLEAYATKFSLTSRIFFNTRVVKVKLNSSDLTWEVSVENNVTNQQSQHVFDFLLVASGFFNRPGSSFDPLLPAGSPNIQHSSKFRTTSSLSERSGKIAVIGGGISGSEAAAQAAFQISNARYSPGGSISDQSESKIYHITNRPFYCLPRYLPIDPSRAGTQDSNLAPHFLPLDLVLYSLSRRNDAMIKASITEVPPDKARKGHEFMRSVIGSDQAEYGRPGLVYASNELHQPGYCGITDTYMEFVRSGLIVPVKGWVEKVEQQPGSEEFRILLKAYRISEEVTVKDRINDVTGIIEATGYKANLDYVQDWLNSDDVLSHDESCPRLPFLLTRGSIFTEKVPTIAFVGFYQGPYWGVMEMQAHVIANTWSSMDFRRSFNSWPERDFFKHEVNERLRRAMKETSSSQLPQFIMGDYVGLMEELAREAGLDRNDSVFAGQTGPVIPSRYHGTKGNREAAIVVEEMCGIIGASEKGTKFVAAAVFRGMQGEWILKRKIDSRHSAAQGGIFEGAAHFHPRYPSSPTYTAEYLYIEEGTFKMDNGYSFPATRRYIYRYDEGADKITAWFADEDGKSSGALFNTWEFYAPEDTTHGCMAKGHHWCDPDTYRNTCEFRFRGASLQTFRITYQVEGPNKDYSHESWYERPLPMKEKE